MGRPLVHASAADRQRAYRERVAQRERSEEIEEAAAVAAIVRVVDELIGPGEWSRGWKLRLAADLLREDGADRIVTQDLA